MKNLTTLSRILVGSLFIVSGLIKANDAIGFSFKLHDYFAPDVLDIPFLMDYTYPFAAFICVAEIMLGLSVLVGAKMQLTAWSLLLMIVFFDGLTFYSAYFDKVTDCGCFGDAIKLTPWESFYKDVVLSVLILIIFVFRSKVTYHTKKENILLLPLSLLLISLFSSFILEWYYPIFFSIILFLGVVIVNRFVLIEKQQWTLAAYVFVVSSVFTYHTYAHLPLRDYRPFAIGKNIAQDMKLPEGAIMDVYEDVWKYELNGEVKDYLTDDKPWEIEGASFVDRITKLILEGDHPPIHDFSIESDENGDITDSILTAPNALLFVMYDLNKSNKNALQKVDNLIKDLSNQDITVVSLSASTEEQMRVIQSEMGVSMPFYFTDETTLKTIVRSNPGILWLQEGTVVNKWHYNDLPSSDELIRQYLN
tara:strand:+ start:139 stop:1401 length:1263 start_codon:yes stop_codon:yes gene_type:complete